MIAVRHSTDTGASPVITNKFAACRFRICHRENSKHCNKERRIMSSKRPHEDSLSSRSQASGGLKRRDLLLSGGSLVAASALSSAGLTASAEAQQSASAQAGQRPNIVVIMGDDIGIWNIGAYHRGMMAGRTPNLDKLAAEGML